MTTTLAIGGPDGARVILPVVPKAARPAPAFLPPESSPALAGFEPPTAPQPAIVVTDPLGYAMARTRWPTATDRCRLATCRLRSQS
jgi:hypothetical protein